MTTHLIFPHLIRAQYFIIWFYFPTLRLYLNKEKNVKIPVNRFVPGKKQSYVYMNRVGKK